MTRGDNDLLNEAHRRLAEASNRIEWFVVGVCVAVSILVVALT